MSRSRFLGQAFAALSLVLMGALLTAAQASQASEQQRRAEEEQWGTRQPTFTELDTNRNGYFFRKEAAQWHILKEKFAAVNQNSDNHIDRVEFRDFESQQIEKILLKFKGSSN